MDCLLRDLFLSWSVYILSGLRLSWSLRKEKKIGVPTNGYFSRILRSKKRFQDQCKRPKSRPCTTNQGGQVSVWTMYFGLGRVFLSPAGGCSMIASPRILLSSEVLISRWRVWSISVTSSKSFVIF